MIKQIIICDCCGSEMPENTGAELTGQLRAKNIKWTELGEMDMPVIELRDICDDCACGLHLSISEFCIAMTVKRVTA